MPPVASLKHLVKKVTLELIYDVVNEKTSELKNDIKTTNERIERVHIELKNDVNTKFNELKNDVNTKTVELKEDIKSLNTRIERMQIEYKEDFKTINSRIDQIHTRLDQIMHALMEIKK